MTATINLLLSLLPLLATVEGACKSGALTQFELAILDKHNSLRALHEDTPDLCYGESGDDVTFTAESWAEAMANAKTMQHSTGGSYGENLAYAGTTGTVPGQEEAYTKSTQAWYDEIKDWDFGKSASKGGVTGHFTQVVWKASKQLNCGYATFQNRYNSYYVVCQYYPPGNYGGQYAAEVTGLKEGGSGAALRFSTSVTALVVLLITVLYL